MTKPNAREAILDTAERLFAEQGMEKVSLRTINTEAGYSVAALHYHFRTKEQLIDELLTQRQGLALGRRQELLDQLNGSGQLSVRGIAEALVLPFAELIITNPERGLRTVKFYFRAYVERRQHARVQEMTEESHRIFYKLLATALPDLDRETLEIRWAIATEITFQGLANVDNILRSRNSEPSTQSYRHYTARLIDFIAGGLAASE